MIRQTEFCETNRDYTIRIAKPGLKYLDFFITLRSAPRLLESGFFPNAKEITETIGVFDQARKVLQLDHQSKRVAFVSVGDGQYPRTGLYTSFMTKWSVHSVDPAMKICWEKVQSSCRSVANLQLHPCRMEEARLHLDAEVERLVLVFVHSHASLREAVRVVRRGFGGRVDAVSLPCCVDDDLGIRPDLEVEDPQILSVRRSLQFYFNLPQELQLAE